MKIFPEEYVFGCVSVNIKDDQMKKDLIQQQIDIIKKQVGCWDKVA
jgi:hypothetical protein